MRPLLRRLLLVVSPSLAATPACEGTDGLPTYRGPATAEAGSRDVGGSAGSEHGAAAGHPAGGAGSGATGGADGAGAVGGSHASGGAPGAGNGGRSGASGATVDNPPSLPAPTGQWVEDGCSPGAPIYPNNCGSSCLFAQCYTPKVPGECLDYMDGSFAAGIVFGPGSFGKAYMPCNPSCADGGGPFVAGPDVPASIGSPGQCCYLALVAQCIGRPLTIRSRPRVAPLRRGWDWNLRPPAGDALRKRGRWLPLRGASRLA